MSYDLMFKNAVAMHEAGQLDEAEAVYRQILETAPSQPDVLNLLGLIAQAKNANTEACSLFMQAIKGKPDEVSFYYNLAFSFKLLGKNAEALEYFEKAIKLCPQVKEAYNEIALIKISNNEHEEARKYWQQAISIDSKYVEAKANLAFSYKDENIGKAIDDLEKLAKEFASESLIFYYLTQLYMQKNNWEKAWNSVVCAKNLNPASDEIRVLLALLSLHDDKKENAKIYFAKAEILNPNNIDALLGLADINSQENNFEEAEKRYKRVLELDANNFDAHNNYAEMLQRAKRTSEALEEYRNAVIINPKSAEVSNNLAMILKDLGEYDEALGLLFNALSYKPNLDEISINISECLISLAEVDRKKACEIAENWIKSYPNNEFARHMSSALKGENIENNKVYAEKLFDHFADNYELVIKNLDYSAPMVMARIAGSLEGCIVDLGCGTGLVGEALKNNRNKLIGVDISKKMLDIAKNKGVYEKLVQSDVVEYLQNNNDFDWVVAADVLGYIGDISEIIKSIKNKKILLSIEMSDEESKYTIQPNGRYKHNPQYVENLLIDNGFDDITKECFVLRTENGKPVNGMIFKGE